MTRIIAAIPARYASTRFPGKPLALIHGRPMIQWVVERVRRVREFTCVIVATDDHRIRMAALSAGAKAILTPERLSTGTDRIAWALRKERYDWVMNVQGDEPLIPPAMLRRLIRAARKRRGAVILTAATPIRERSEYLDANAVKVVFDRDGRALYFSRAPIPDASRLRGAMPERVFRHIGVYLFHAEAFRRFTRAPESPLERAEKLEQLRAMEMGIPIYVVPFPCRTVNVDVPADIRKVEACLQRPS